MALPPVTPDITYTELERMMKSASEASSFLKAISHEAV